MLHQLLAEIRAGGALETNRLAARLDASPQLIEAMLEHLQQSGLIQEYIHCGEGCQGCSLSASCPKPDRGAIRLWQSK